MGLGFQHRLAAFTLRAHLLGHDLFDGGRRLDVLELDTGDLEAPRVGGFIQDRFHALVDLVAGRQGLVQLHFTDDVTKGGRGKVLQTGQGIFHAVDVELRIEDFTEDDGVDGHGDVVLRNDRLRREVEDLFFQGDFRSDTVDERDLDMDAGFPALVEFTEPFDDVGLRLGNDTDIGDDQVNSQCDEDQIKNRIRHLVHSFENMLYCQLVDEYSIRNIT